MSRMTSNLGLLIISFLLAVGLVSIKGQEKINRRVISGVQVTVENLPANMMLPPDPWLTPTTTLSIQGPRNFIDFVRADKASFRIDYTNVPSPEVDAPVNILLTNEMFRTNLEPQDRAKISVIEQSVRPRQVVLKLIPWNIEQPLPDLSKHSVEGNHLLLPVLRIEKRVPVVVPQEGDLPEGFVVQSLSTEPETIKITGRRDAVDRIQSASTPPLALNYLSTDIQGPKLLTLPLEDIPVEDVSVVDETIRNVTVTVQLRETQ